MFREAIERQYWYELFMDDLPIWGFVGEVRQAGAQGQQQQQQAAAGSKAEAAGGAADGGKEGQAFIFTHKTFDISYNEDRVRKARGALAVRGAAGSSAPRRGWQQRNGAAGGGGSERPHHARASESLPPPRARAH